MLVLLESGGLSTGGINFDAKVRRNSTDPEDLFIGHITGMDAFARALLAAAAILESSAYRSMRATRYASFDSGPGAEFEKGKLSLADLDAIARQSGEPKQISGMQEKFERLVSMYI